MELIRFILSASGPLGHRLIVAMLATSLSMGALMVIINLATRTDAGDPSAELIVGYVLLAAAVIGGHRYSTRLTTALSEAVLQQIRDNYVTLVRRLEVDSLERTGASRIYDTVARDTIMISDAAPLIMTGMISGVTFVMLGAYIAWLSGMAILILGVALLITVYFYRYSQRNSRGAMLEASNQETRFLDLLSHLLYGYKEVRQNTVRGSDLERNFLLPVSALIDQRNTEAMVKIANGMSISYVGFYGVLAGTVFVLPGFANDHAVVVQVLFIVLFMLSSLDNVLRSLSVLARANLALERLRDMEKRLVEAAGREEPPPGQTPSFRRVELRGAAYSYLDREGKATFTMGPCDLAIEPREIVFLVGGNGSGKSTLMRLLTGLYAPSTGIITWDGKAVLTADRGNYRQLFSCVFADFHLFDRLYGARDIDPAKVNRMIDDMGLTGKTAYVDGRFTHLDLSTGQRKRLALIVALLEDRPIYVLDEVGADQDPVFRERYYRKILPELRDRGKAVIVISHDDRYFDLGDRRLTMQDGRLTMSGAIA